jgi:hypothetical protein
VRQIESEKRITLRGTEVRIIPELIAPRGNSSGLARIAQCRAAAKSPEESPLEVAERIASNAVIAALRKGYVSAGSIGGDSWGAELAELSQQFIDALQPRSAFYSLCSLGPATPFRTPATIVPAFPVSEREEGGALRVAMTELQQQTPDPLYAAALFVVTRELARSTDPAAFAKLRKALEDGAVTEIDRVAWAALSDGVAAVAATADVLDDIRAMLTIVSKAAGGLLFACDQKTSDILVTQGSTLTGSRLFPGMRPDGGEICGVPVVVSTALPNYHLALMRADGFSTNSGGVTVDESRHSSLQMVDENSDQNSITPTDSQLVSLWQTGAVALRINSRFIAERLKDDALAIRSQTFRWTGATSS